MHLFVFFMYQFMMEMCLFLCFLLEGSTAQFLNIEANVSRASPPKSTPMNNNNNTNFNQETDSQYTDPTINLSLIEEIMGTLI